MKGIIAIVSVVALTAMITNFGGCGKSNAPTDAKKTSAIIFTPPDGSFAKALGITSGPITAEQAKAIAARAAGGTALFVEQEDEDGVQVFGVKVQVGASIKDVKVRISDGAVTKIEDDGLEGEGEGQGEGN